MDKLSGREVSKQRKVTLIEYVDILILIGKISLLESRLKCPILEVNLMLFSLQHLMSLLRMNPLESEISSFSLLHVLLIVNNAQVQKKLIVKCAPKNTN